MVVDVETGELAVWTVLEIPKFRLAGEEGGKSEIRSWGRLKIICSQREGNIVRGSCALEVSRGGGGDQISEPSTFCCHGDLLNECCSIQKLRASVRWPDEAAIASQ